MLYDPYLYRSRSIRTPRFIAHRLYEEWREWRLGVGTYEYASTEALGFTDSDCNAYGPISYPAIDYCLRRVPIEGAFLDYGCGLGRALFVAAQKPFTRVIGVEYAETLVAKAKANAGRARARLRCPVVIETADASTYPLPDDVRVIHFNNPFRGEVLRKTVQQIRHSLDRAPRELWIAYAGAGSFEKLLPLPWVEFVEARRFYQTWGYRIYRCSP